MTSESPAILNDEDIILRYLENGDSSLFDLLYDRYVDKVFAKCIGMLESVPLAEDATQEIFLKVLVNISKFKGNARFSTWLYSITYNYCIDFIRKSKKLRVVVSEDEIEDEPIEEVSDKELLEIKIDRLEEVLRLANERDRAVLMMKYTDEMSIKEMAAAMNASESAVKMNILRAKHRLKKLYKSLYNE